MKFPLFASFIVFCIWLAYEINKTKISEYKRDKSFWDKEADADNTRRKPLDGLDYVKIPLDQLPMDILSEKPAMRESYDTLRSLALLPIVNFTGISNTDLKLTYGAPNINLLTQYDTSYTLLVRCLHTLSEALYQEGYLSESKTFLEFAISTRTDIKASYLLLCSIYRETGEPERISELIPIAQTLNSSLKNAILKSLEEQTSSTVF